MRFTRPGWAVLVVGLSMAVAAPSGAKPGEPGEPSHGEGKGEHERRDRDRDDRGRGDKERDGGKGEHPRGDDDRDGAKDSDKDDEKSIVERREFRRGLFERREKAIVEELNRDRREMTEEVQAAIRLHWRHLARLLRIHELALAAKEDAFVKRAEADIDREEKAFTARLERLHTKADGGAR